MLFRRDNDERKPEKEKVATRGLPKRTGEFKRGGGPTSVNEGKEKSVVKTQGSRKLAQRALWSGEGAAKEKGEKAPHRGHKETASLSDCHTP